MTLVPILRNAELSFRAGLIEVPLEPLVSRGSSGEGSRDLVAPKIAAPDLADSLEMEPVRQLALRELIRQADSGKVRVAIPLPKQKLSVGPVSLDLTAGHAAVIELEVDTARVLRKKTRGTIEPPIRMPLGLSFQGLYLNDYGEVIADIANFPDINLSRWSDQVPQIPSTLDQVLDLLFPEKPPAEEAPPPAEEKADKPEPIDLSGLTVEARAVQPRCVEPLDLGEVGLVMLGKETKIDVEYSRTALIIRGHAHLERSHIAGRGFSLEGVSAAGDGEWRLFGEDGNKEMYLGVSDAWVRAERARVSLGEDGELVFGPTVLSGVEIVVRSGFEPELSLSAEHLTSELAGGRILVLHRREAGGRLALTGAGLGPRGLLRTAALVRRRGRGRVPDRARDGGRPGAGTARSEPADRARQRPPAGELGRDCLLRRSRGHRGRRQLALHPRRFSARRWRPARTALSGSPSWPSTRRACAA